MSVSTDVYLNTLRHQWSHYLYNEIYGCVGYIWLYVVLCRSAKCFINQILLRFMECAFCIANFCHTISMENDHHARCLHHVQTITYKIWHFVQKWKAYKMEFCERLQHIHSHSVRQKFEVWGIIRPRLMHTQTHSCWNKIWFERKLFHCLREMHYLWQMYGMLSIKWK